MLCILKDYFKLFCRLKDNYIHLYLVKDTKEKEGVHFFSGHAVMPSITTHDKASTVIRRRKHLFLDFLTSPGSASLRTSAVRPA